MTREPAFGGLVLRPAGLDATVASIEAVQVSSGMIPWFEGGHCDPWNHVESAMALAVGGRRCAAERGYEWLRATQHESGAWFNYYWPDGSVEDARLDTNVCAYVAAGIWHQYLATGDSAFVMEMWPMVERAITFVLSWQRPEGELIWSIRPDGTPESYALLTGSCSAYLSLRCAIACAELVGAERPEWELAAGRLRHAIVYKPERFAPKDRYAMDWYYPVLAGAFDATAATERLRSQWEIFVMEGCGVRCVSDRPWVTVAETAECALACLGAGQLEEAERLLSWLSDQRDPDGSYTTGRVYPERTTFPHEERSTYTAAAVVLAFDALAGLSTTSGLFVGRGLPFGLDLDELDEETAQTTSASVNPS
ncbi:MAG: prenyltransferase/squalene oxidase repeat-containing protein [Acidimicrobiales bacterium]